MYCFAFIYLLKIHHLHFSGDCLTRRCHNTIGYSPDTAERGLDYRPPIFRLKKNGISGENLPIYRERETERERQREREIKWVQGR